MPCYRPRKGYRSRTVNPSGKRSIVFNTREGFHDLPVDISCGQCIGCRLKRSAEWAVRIHHEASLHQENCYLTLTYDDDHLPENGSLQVEDFQKFMKRFRKEVHPLKLRFFHCGEYGDKFSRPHYHACVFGYEFKDKELFSERGGIPLYTSKTLENLWKKGHCTTGEVTFDSAAYVARYITKKVLGPRADLFYNERDESGEIIRSLKPEYVTMSRRPGIGKQWFEKFKGDVFPGDYVVIDGKKMPPPKYYRGQLEIISPKEFRDLRGRGLQRAEEAKADENNSWDRMRVREEITISRLKQLKRGYENED